MKRRIVSSLVLVAVTIAPFASGEEEHEPTEPPAAPLSVGRATASALLVLAPGLGLGHAVAGEWEDSGWRFTLGEAASLGTFVYGLSLCKRCISVDNGDRREDHPLGAPLVLIGLGGFATFRVIEVIDLFQRMKARSAPPEPETAGLLAPVPHLLPGGGGVTMGARF